MGDEIENTVPPKKVYKQPFISVLPTFFILTSCSFHYTWTLVRNPIFENDVHLVISWFIGGIIGAVVAASLTYILPRRIFCWIAGALSLGSGIILAVKPDHVLITVARYLSGFSFGLAFVPGIIHAAEIAHKSIRGAACSIVCLGMVTALFIGSILFLTTDDVDLYHGVLCFAFAIAGLIASLWIIESPTFHLIKNNAVQAEENLKKLRNSSVTTPEIFEELEDTRTLITGSNRLSRNPFTDGNTSVIITIALLRVVYALSLSLPLIEQSTKWLVMFGEGRWSFFTIIILRIITEVLSIIFVDALCRLTLTSKSLVLAAIVLLAFGTFFEIMGSLIVSIETFKLIYFGTVLYQFCAGMDLGASSALLLGQWFPIAKKRWSVFLVFTIEMLVHIMAYCLRDVGRYFIAQFFLLGSLSLVIGIGLCFLVVMAEAYIELQIEKQKTEQTCND